MLDLLSSKNLYCFDLDDTLINTKESFDYALKKGLLAVSSEIPNFNSQADFDLLRTICKSFGTEKLSLGFETYHSLRVSKPENLKQEQKFYEVYQQSFWGKLTTFPGVFELLEKLKFAEKILGIVSNSGRPDYQKEKIGHTGLTDFFSESLTLISGDFSPDFIKPSEKMFREILKRARESSEHSLYAGNMFSDLLASKSAGFYTVFFDPEKKQKFPVLLPPDLLLLDWREF